MLQETPAIDVYFEDQIQILADDPEGFPLKTVREVLLSKEVQFTSISTHSEM